MFLIGGGEPIRLRITIQNDAARFLPNISPTTPLCIVTGVVFAFVVVVVVVFVVVVLVGGVVGFFVPVGGSVTGSVVVLFVVVIVSPIGGSILMT